MKLNINCEVLIRETEIGKKNFDKSYSELHLDPEEYRKLYRQPDGRLKMPLWEVMQVYGHLCMNGASIPIETEIEILGVD